MKIGTLLIYLFMTNVNALEIDSKVLGTIIKVSESKKTILINKGTEQGIRKELHAKLSLPSGVIARGIAVKVSPSRSVWSLYRIWKVDKVEKDVAVLLKISKPVKLTSDESKSLGKLAAVADKKTEKLNMGSRKFDKNQKAIKRSIILKERATSAYSDEDFSSLQEDLTEAKKDQEVDWTSLDGKRDGEYFDRRVDYSSLK
jgi:hypothetical protein